MTMTTTQPAPVNETAGPSLKSVLFLVSSALMVVSASPEQLHCCMSGCANCVLLQNIDMSTGAVLSTGNVCAGHLSVSS